MREAPIVADRGEHIDFLLGKFQHGHAFTEEVVAPEVLRIRHLGRVLH